GQRAKHQVEPVLANLAAALNDVSLFECRETAPAIAPDRLVEREHRGAGPAVESPLVGVFLPVPHVRHEIEAERAAARKDTRNGSQRRRQIAWPGERLQNSIRGDHRRKGSIAKRQRANVPANESGGARGFSRASEHLRRAIDPDDVNAGAREGAGYAPGPGPESHHG